MTHPCCSGTEMRTYKKGFKKTLWGAVNGHKKILPEEAITVDGLRTLVRVRWA